ncbi:hypothetical protein SAMN04488505_10479 [Chitinophaga rupis]|uniref:Uncharacterized protein n=1 Tax=Chitinophaga rupis TaxID=573321 RepID=A0A1H7XHQ9_9BACT|nr:hypothetical protein SAMN04488505_10479 [Chitinophaga rupis]
MNEPAVNDNGLPNTRRLSTMLYNTTIDHVIQFLHE